VPTVSAMRMRQTTTASRLRQKPETVTLFSTSESLFSRFRRPMSYSLERRSASLACRKGSADGRSERRWASWRSEPASLLYLGRGRGTSVAGCSR
jgi:hypothetical protein